MDQNLCFQKLFESMPKRILAVNGEKGGPTQYWQDVPIKWHQQCFTSQWLYGVEPLENTQHVEITAFEPFTW